MDWHEVWERKGRAASSDLKDLDGFEETSVDPILVAGSITKAMGIAPTDKVLEVGCGAGMIAQHLVCDYVGVDYSASLVEKHAAILGHRVVLGQANVLQFEDQSFDHVFCYSVFHYFPDKAYARRVIEEMTRVATRCVFIGDLPLKSHRQEHLLFGKEEFGGWKISDGYYNPDRFNVLRQLT